MSTKQKNNKIHITSKINMLTVDSRQNYLTIHKNNNENTSRSTMYLL